MYINCYQGCIAAIIGHITMPANENVQNTQAFDMSLIFSSLWFNKWKNR